LGLSAYWFATNLKWFILLSAVLPSQVEQLVPGGEKGGKWGAVVMLGALWALFGPALFGHLSDRTRTRFGRWRPFLAIGSALTCVALMVLSDPSSYLVIVAGYLLLQVSDDVAQGPYSSLIPSLVPEEQRGRASGVMALLLMAAQIVGGVGAFMLKGDIRAIYLLIAVVNVTCALITLSVVRDEPPEVERKKVPFADAWLKPWQNPDFRWVWFTRFLNALGFYLIYNYLKYFLSDRVGDFHFFSFDIAPIGDGSEKAVQSAAFQAVFVLLLLISLIGCVSAVVGGKLADKVGRKRVIYWSGAMMTLPLIPFTLFPNFTAIVLLSIPFAIGYGAYQSADWALASDVMPDAGTMAKDMGLWQSSISAPQIFSGAAGRVVDFGNRAGPGFGYTYTFLFATLAFALGIILIRKVRGST
jgi:MFS family permease